MLKGLIAEHSLPVTDIEALTRPKAEALVDNWFLKHLTGEDKGAEAMQSLTFTFGERKPNTSEVKTTTEITDKKETKDKASLEKVFSKELKIPCQVDCKSGISYMSLRRQIDSALAKGYTELDVIDAIIKAFPPTSGLRRYLEGKEALNLNTAKNTLRAHNNEKTATDCTLRNKATVVQRVPCRSAGPRFKSPNEGEIFSVIRGFLCTEPFIT